jgi:hypothetical protein
MQCHFDHPTYRCVPKVLCSIAVDSHALKSRARSTQHSAYVGPHNLTRPKIGTLLVGEELHGAVVARCFDGVHVHGSASTVKSNASILVVPRACAARGVDIADDIADSLSRDWSWLVSVRLAVQEVKLGLST